MLDRGDVTRCVLVAGALVARLLHDAALERQPLSSHATMVSIPNGPRFVVVESSTEAGDPAVAVLAAWEFALAGDVEVDVLRPDDARWLQ
jgi:hypothetical protein